MRLSKSGVSTRHDFLWNDIKISTNRACDFGGDGRSLSPGEYYQFVCVFFFISIFYYIFFLGGEWLYSCRVFIHLCEGKQNSLLFAFGVLANECLSLCCNYPATHTYFVLLYHYTYVLVSVRKSDNNFDTTIN